MSASATRNKSKTLLRLASLAVAAIALPASARTLVVLNKAEATASLVDLATGEVRATLPTGTGPHEVAVSPDGRRALVADYGAQVPGSTLTVLDLATPKVEKSIALGEYTRPHGIQFLADGKRALVTSETKQSLLLVDVDAGTVLQAMATNANSSHMVVATSDTAGARAFVANIGSGSISAIDLATGKLLKVIPTGAGSEGIDATPDGRAVWVTNRAADTVSVVDAKTLEVVATLPAGSFPIRAKATPDGKHVLVSNAKSGDVIVYDAVARKEVRRIPMKATATDTAGKLFADQFGASPVPIGILIEPDGKRAYVAMASADAIAVLDLEKWEVVGALKAGREPDGLGFTKLVIAPTKSG